MDIDELVRRARPDSAGWARGDGGRRVLEGVAATGEPPRRRTVKVVGRPVLRWSVLGSGLVGAVATAVLVVSAISSPQGPRTGTAPVTGGGPAAAGSARDILLAAATRAEQAPAETGRYWHVKTLDVHGPMRVGAAPDGYWLLRRSLNESWDASDPREASWTGFRNIGVRPRSGADERAWRAAGSPTEWTLDTDRPNKLVLSTQPDEGRLDRDPDPPRYLEDLGPLSQQQLRALPEEPEALRTWVTSRLRRMGNAADGGAENNRLLFGFLGRMLLDTPAPPKVRAAAFRILADIPGVRVLDDSGDIGQGVEFSDGVTIERLIVDESTHRLLGRTTTSSPNGGRTPGKESSTLVLIAEWSDAAPQVPTLPQE